MNKAIVCLIAIALILGSISGFLYMQKTSLERQVSTLTSEKESLIAQVTSLTHEKENLTATVAKLSREKASLEGVIESQRRDISSLNGKIRDLTSQVQTLSSERAKLQNTVSVLNAKAYRLQGEKSSLTMQLNQVRNELNYVGTNYEKWAGFLLSYSSSTRYLNYTAKRVFSDDELEGLRDLLMDEVLTNPKYLWESEQDIYDWITSNIKYVRDEPFPWPPSFDTFISGNVKDEVVYDSMMAPSQTLSLKQGDCDDQAALAYAMIKSYEKHILGKEYTDWLMHMDFTGNIGHMAVAFPASGAENQTLLTIIDPAGHYLTKDIFGRITAKDPFVELDNYKDYWAKDGYTIKTITLYEIKNGVVHVMVSGSVHEVASYVASH